MFLGQSDDASVESEKRWSESFVRVLRRSADHQRMDATNKRDAGNMSRNDQAEEFGVIACRYSLCNPATG